MNRLNAYFLPSFSWASVSFLSRRLLVIGVSVMTACESPEDVKGLDTADDSGVTFPASLEDHVMPIIDLACGGCHTRTDSPFSAAVVNGVYYDKKEDILNLVGTYILPGDSANSGFFSILSQDLAVGQGPTLMPPPHLAEPLNEADLSIIGAWIDQGALDN